MEGTEEVFGGWDTIDKVMNFGSTIAGKINVKQNHHKMD